MTKFLQVLSAPIALPFWAVLVIVHKNMEPVDLEDFTLV